MSCLPHARTHELANMLWADPRLRRAAGHAVADEDAAAVRTLLAALEVVVGDDELTDLLDHPGLLRPALQSLT